VKAEALLGVGMSSISYLPVLTLPLAKAPVFALELRVSCLFLLQIWQDKNDDEAYAAGDEAYEEPGGPAASPAAGDHRTGDPKGDPYDELD